MLKLMFLPVAAAILFMGAANMPAPTAGSWQVDSRHSDVQLVTDGMTDFGKTKVNFTTGFARVEGTVKLDDTDPARSKVDFRLYPASSSSSPIGEDGKIKAEWLANVANHTLVCFHSKKIVRTPDGKLQATGDLVVTRVDRNIEASPTEAYTGPVYGPAVVHRVVREAAFVFDIPAGTASAQANAGLVASGSTSISRESYPELVRTVVGTYWPPLVQDEHCKNPASGSEDYRGLQCTGTFMEAAGLPPAPTHVGEDYPGVQNFDAVVGNQLTILVHLQLRPTMTTNATPAVAGGEFDAVAAAR